MQVADAWPHCTVLEMAALVHNLRVALGYKNNGHKRSINTDRPPEEMYEGAACSLSGG